MNYHYDTKDEAHRVAEARDSFSGRLLSDAQFSEAIAITGIIEREIRKSGSFKDKLGDYANAYARSERFDAAKGDTIIRDLFKARTGQTMNQMREDLMKREEALTDADRQAAYQHACDVGTLIEEGNKISFSRAYAHYGELLAQELQITDAMAKRLMAEEFEAVEKVSLYDWGKELEERFYRPQIEAEKQERAAQRSRNPDRDTGSRETARRNTNGRDMTGRDAVPQEAWDHAREQSGQDAQPSARPETRTARRPMTRTGPSMG